MERLQITTLAAQDITSPLLVATYTADADKELLVQLYLSGLAGSGAYRACLTKQLGGAGAIYQSPTAAVTLSGGVTTAFLPTLPLPVKSGDVIKVYAQGLAGDTGVSVSTEVFDVTATATASLAAQDVADALKLAPTAGASAAGSVYAELAALPTVVGAALAGSGITVNLRPVVQADGSFVLYQGYDYDADDNRAVEFVVATPDFTGATPSLIFDGTTFAGAVVDPGLTTQLLRFEFTAAQTTALTAGYHAYRLEVTRAGRKLLEEVGIVEVKE